VAAVLGALQLDHHQPRRAIDAQKVDSAVGVLKLAELLGNQQVLTQDLDPVANRRLQMLAFQNGLGGKRRLWDLGQAA